MRNLAVKDITQFVPAKDVELSTKFYSKLGCKLINQVGKFSQFELCGCRFYLQDFYVKEHAENYMMHFSVNDVDSWYQQVNEVLEDFPVAAGGSPRLVTPLQEEASGAKSFQLVDPTSVLITFAQFGAKQTVENVRDRYPSLSRACRLLRRGRN